MGSKPDGAIARAFKHGSKSFSGYLELVVRFGARPAYGVERAPFLKYELHDIADDVERSARRRRLFADFRSKVAATRKKARPYTVVDMFCGCGGLSFGLESTGRFRTLVGIDISEDALQTFAHNHHSAGTPPKTFAADIAKLEPRQIRTELRKLGILTGQLDCLVGGPPCEGFSQNHGKAMAGRGHAFVAHNGRSTKAWYKSLDARRNGKSHPLRRSKLRDERNTLFRKILDVAELVKPKIVLIENVREFLVYDDGALKDEIIERLEQANYHVEVRYLNAANYGVPQQRRRAFFIGTRNDVAKAFGKSLFPEPTHRPTEDRDGKDLLVGDRGIHVTVWEAIGDLPPAVRGKSTADAAVVGQSTRFRRFVRDRSKAMPTHHVVRTMTAKVKERIKAIRPGMKVKHLPRELRTKKFYENAYARLEWHKPANTITKSFTNPGSGKFCHPTQTRGITVREAARLQSFPDFFEFFGKSQRAVADMIGGAVPPLLARAFGLSFADALDAAEKAERARKRKKFARDRKASERR
jgi:DNA (cytosine-5)-methyltransferase 1